MAYDAFYTTGSAVFQCTVYHRTVNVKQKLFLSFVFKSYSQANMADTVNMKALLLNMVATILYPSLSFSTTCLIICRQYCKSRRKIHSHISKGLKFYILQHTSHGYLEMRCPCCSIWVILLLSCLQSVPEHICIMWTQDILRIGLYLRHASAWDLQEILCSTSPWQ
jgi:hypothetical protein